MVEAEQLVPLVHIALSALLNPLYKLRSIVLAIIKPQPKRIGIIDSGAINMTPTTHQDEVGCIIRAIGALGDDMAALKRAPARPLSHAPPTLWIVIIKMLYAKCKACSEVLVYLTKPHKPSLTDPIVINL